MEANETISPSAYALLMMKSHTSIPFAREAAALVDPSKFNALSAGREVEPADYWGRVLHFESRYWSINQLMEDLTATNILEISSGFSFRGLDLTRKKPVFYIDTDLPDIISGKQQFIEALTARASGASPGHYELHPLNALDPAAFDAIIAKFPPGPLTIINEGLLVYLDPTEKTQLCANIRKALLGPPAGPSAPPSLGRVPGFGNWITADIYIRNKEADAGNEAWQQWSRQHNLEEKKFAGFPEAEAFFDTMGFQKEKEATPDYASLTSFPQFLKSIGPKRLDELRKAGRPRIHATWRLKPIP